MYKYMILGICLVLLSAGCGKESESPSPPPQEQNKVIRKKITVRPDNMPSETKPASTENVIAKKPVPEPPPAVPVTENKTGAAVAQKPVPEPPPAVPVTDNKAGAVVAQKPVPEPPPAVPVTDNKAGAAVAQKPVTEPAPATPPENISSPGEQAAKNEAEEPPPWMKQVKATEKKAGSPVPSDALKNAPAKSAEAAKSEAGAAPDGKPLASISILENLKGAGNIKIYSPEGKIDPFIPLFKKEKPVEKKVLEEKADAADNDKIKKVQRVRRERTTPLEKVDLSQLKLVGIIRGTRSGDKAVVEDGNNKGYIVTKGTYIGIHYGIVEEIKRDRIVVREEEGEDLAGKIKYREREMMIQRPPGEDYYEM